MSESTATFIGNPNYEALVSFFLRAEAEQNGFQVKGEETDDSEN